jgi:L-asparagine transporter-like permease
MTVGQIVVCLLVWVLSIAFCILTCYNIKTDKIKFIKHKNILFSMISSLTILVFAVVLAVWLDNTHKELLAKVSSFAAPIFYICIVIIYQSIVKAKKMILDTEGKENSK